ncbi:unnamed protein product [Boreogadus saida]
MQPCSLELHRTPGQRLNAATSGPPCFNGSCGYKHLVCPSSMGPQCGRADGDSGFLRAVGSRGRCATVAIVALPQPSPSHGPS